MLIFVPKVANRLNYIFKLIFEEILGVEYRLITNISEFNEYTGVKINYSQQPLKNEIFFAAVDLLFEKEISSQKLKFIDFNNSKTFFQVYNNNSALPFDPFASCFYMVSRFEEYLPYIKDKYGRFEPKESIALKHGFLHKPVVNIWINEIAKIINKEYPLLQFRDRKYKFIPTYDIDIAYSYKLKGILRNISGYAKSLLNLDFIELTERTKVLCNKLKDPLDTYDLQFEIQRKYELYPLYFILFGEYGEYDKNISVNNKNFHSLVKSLADYAKVGIHPSFGSNANFEKLKREKNNLSAVLNKEIDCSRQHFLKIAIPHAYRNLIKLDILNDYTMGFASQSGFRAGICDSFSFYDLDLDVETKLRIHPFAVMDGTLNDYLNLSPDEALAKVKSIIDEVKAVKGTFISLWHNESLSDKKRWNGWKKVYENMVEYAIA